METCSMRAITLAPDILASPRARPAPGGDRATFYNGLVSKFVYDCASRGDSVSRPADVEAVPEDFWHGISVACGYLGLVAGFGALAAAIW